VKTSRILQKQLSQIVDVEQRIATYCQAQPTDTIDLSTAENVLLFEFYQKHVFDWQHRSPITVNDTRYPRQIYGSQSYQQSWVQFLDKAWGGGSILSENDVYGVGGVSAALECLAFCLGSPGETVISPAPLWYGFPWSFDQRPKMVFTPFYLTAAGVDKFELTLADVQRAYRETNPKPRFLVLTNPNNPLGGNYAKPLLESIYEWVLDYTDMHIISDEIYFLSQVTGGERFAPAYTLDAVKNASPHDQQRVHVVWGLAKDFGLSGFKVGFVISKNPTVQKMMKGAANYKSMAWFTPFSSLSQYVLAPLFLGATGNADPAIAQQAMSAYAGAPQTLLAQQYQAAKQALDAGRIAYRPHNESAIFFWLDLRKFLDLVPDDFYSAPLHANSDPREDRLSQYITVRAGVSLIPGQECYSPIPGYFRLCYTAQKKDVVVDGINKIAKALNGLLPKS
jgi:aspartate/methionine/tyrosine aminotransferase